MPDHDDTPPVATVLLGCSQCGAALPPDAQFCLKCGKPVAIAPQSSEKPTNVIEAIRVQPARKRRRLRFFFLSLLALFLIAILWATISNDPYAQGVQEFVGWKHDQAILDSSFTVAPHNFRYYKFALPEGSMNVAMIGQFSLTIGSEKRGNSEIKHQDEADSGIEVYVLSEPAFTVWQKGFTTSSVYESGRVSQGTVQSDLPSGSGIYYLVFSNKFSAKSPKNVSASVLLRYKSWLPTWFRSVKGRVSNWFSI